MSESIDVAAIGTNRLVPHRGVLSSWRRRRGRRNVVATRRRWWWSFVSLVAVAVSVAIGRRWGGSTGIVVAALSTVASVPTVTTSIGSTIPTPVPAVALLPVTLLLLLLSVGLSVAGAGGCTTTIAACGSRTSPWRCRLLLARALLSPDTVAVASTPTSASISATVVAAVTTASIPVLTLSLRLLVAHPGREIAGWLTGRSRGAVCPWRCGAATTTWTRGGLGRGLTVSTTVVLDLLLRGAGTVVEEVVVLVFESILSRATSWKIAPVGATSTLWTVAGQVTSITTSTTDDVGSEVLGVGAIPFTMTNFAAVLTSLVFVVAESTVEGSEFTKLTTLEIVLTFGD